MSGVRLLWLLLAGLVWAMPAAAEDAVSVRDRLKSCDAGVAIAAAEQLIHSAVSRNEPLEMFTPAAVLFFNGKKDDAVFWFYAAQLRSRYKLVFDPGDRELLAAVLMTYGPPINNYAYQDVEKLNGIIDRVFEWDERTPNPWRQEPEAAQKQAEVEEVYDGFRALQAKLSERKEEIEGKARNAAPTIQQAYVARREKLCADGQPDPVYADQTIRKEWTQVIEFVKADETVISESGGIRQAVAETYSMQPDQVLPDRYIVAVEGNARRFSAVIDALRGEQGSVEFNLACLAETAPDKRDPQGDVCQ